MSDAAASTITPTNLGKHLRAVRRKKGLSLSEVARGAGLSRRELVAYERGKVPIPESDLWVLAGSCGVDVGDLLPPTPVPEFAAIPTSIGDTVAQLRQSHDDPHRQLPAPARSRELPVGSAAPVEAHPYAAPNGQPAHSVDVFQELSQLPEPPELPDPTVPIDLLAPPPIGTVEMIDDEFANFDSHLGSGYAAEHRPNQLTMNGAALVSVPEPVLVDSAASYAGSWNAADAPPIDVAFRGGSTSGWDANASVANDSPPSMSPDAPPWPAAWDTPSSNGGNHSDAHSTDPGTAGELPSSLWETTDTWTPDDARRAEPEVAAPPAPWDIDSAPPAPWDVDAAPMWPVDAADSWPTDPAPSWPTDPAPSWPSENGDAPAAGDTYPGWGRDPDPEATSTGFYVDWGTAEPEADVGQATESADALDSADAVAPENWGAQTWTPETWAADPVAPAATSEALVVHPPQVETEPESDDDGFEPIMWRAEPARSIPTAITFPDPTTVEPTTADPEPAPAPAQFIVAGSEWQLGNALPLVEVRGTGSLVMRRADERWALADVNTTPDFVLEVDVDFRSGPGLGILFCASVDDEGRMSGYSFDIDPIYDGGGYLVRQWQHDRELWNPIARVSAGDPESMCGAITVRLVVENDCLVASVNNAEVLTVDGLKQASADRGRDPATGNRVGVQAWSSSDLVIETLRVAPR